jgi:hypothetical protein
MSASPACPCNKSRVIVRKDEVGTGLPINAGEFTPLFSTWNAANGESMFERSDRIVLHPMSQKRNIWPVLRRVLFWYL